MRRRLVTLLVVCSLLLSVALCVLWVRSYWITDRYMVDTGRGMIGAGSYRGGLYVSSVTEPPDRSARVTPEPGFSSEPVKPDAANLPGNWSFAGFVYTYVNLFGVVIWQLTVPCWALLLLLLSPTVGRAITRRAARRRRTRQGLCPNCGYDIRATPERCPECGAVSVTG